MYVYIVGKKIQILLFRMSVLSMREFNEKLKIFKCPSVGNFVVPLGQKIYVPRVLS